MLGNNKIRLQTTAYTQSLSEYRLEQFSCSTLQTMERTLS